MKKIFKQFIFFSVLIVPVTFSIKIANTGTAKSLGWCYYRDFENNRGGNINKTRCITTMGSGGSYCFNLIVLKNGSIIGGNCNTWRYHKLTDTEKRSLNNLFGQWDKNVPENHLLILKHSKNSDIIIFYSEPFNNIRSRSLAECLKHTSTAAGVAEPGDFCWIGDAARKIEEPLKTPDY